MAHLNTLNQFPLNGDVVKRVKFSNCVTRATIIFESGKKITLHISDIDNYSILDYNNDNLRNVRESKIDKIIDK